MRNTFHTWTTVLLLAMVIFYSCEKEYSFEGGSGNQPPVADAGTDQMISLPADSVLLNGTSSYDPDGRILNWKWNKIKGPAASNLVQSDSAKTKLRSLSQGVYQFELKVTDDKGASARDTVQVTVDAGNTSNKAPAACAGQDRTVELPVNSVILDGTCSTDPDKNIVAFTWVKISGPASAQIATPLAVTTEVKELAEGTYLFQLKVTDAGGLFSFDTVKVTVKSTTISPVDVYVSGMANSQAIYWKNGVGVPLPSKSVEAVAHAIVVVGKDVYVAGEEGDLFMYGNNIAKYWKNGQEVLLTGATGAGAYSIAVDGSDVYVAGWEYKGTKTVAKYWKNGQSVVLTDGKTDAWAYDIKIVDGNVYVVGHEGNAARYWKNGQTVTVSENGLAYGIAVNGSDVFVAGEEWDIAVIGYATYWKNGQPVNLMRTKGRSLARSIAVEGSHVYVAGYEDIFDGAVYVDSKGRYWKDGQEVLLEGSAIVNSIAVFKEDIYVAGFHPKDPSGARYWVNGKAVTLSGTWATGVFLAPR